MVNSSNFPCPLKDNLCKYWGDACCCSVMTLWTAAHQASLSFTISQSLIKLMSIESVMSCNHFTLCHPLLLPSIFPRIKVFSNESVLHFTLAKVLEFQLQHQSFQWIFRVDFLWNYWFDIPEAQGTLKSLLQHHSLKASILQCSAFFMVQLSHLYSIQIASFFSTTVFNHSLVHM